MVAGTVRLDSCVTVLRRDDTSELEDRARRRDGSVDDSERKPYDATCADTVLALSTGNTVSVAVPTGRSCSLRAEGMLYRQTFKGKLLRAT